VTAGRAGRSRPTALLVVCVALVPAVLASSAVAGAAWSTSGSGGGSGAAEVVQTGAQPSGRASATEVIVSWAPATLSGGQAVTGYLVSRTDAATGATSAAGAGCAGVVTTNHCIETSVPAGDWIYTDRPVLQSWNGPVSPGSLPITVP
jgi:hypothetical protein